MQKKTHAHQSIWNFFFALYEKKQLKTLAKVPTDKNVFSSVYFIGATFFAKYFLFYVITGRHFLLISFSLPAYRKSRTQDTKVGPGMRDLKVGPTSHLRAQPKGPGSRVVP